MKQCPACRTTYTDETLSYCLADGTPLDAVLDEQPTVVRPAAGHVIVDIPQQQTQPVFVPTPTQQTSGGGMKFVVAGLVGLILLLLAGGVVAMIFYLNRNSEIGATNTNARSNNSPNASPTTDDQSKLKDQIANLERRLNEQKNANRPAANVPPTTSTGNSARVNSPGDGFLALRSSPSSQSGQRILKIPHGATIVLGECLAGTGKSGRWCRTSYNGYSGWVFDAFLIY